MPFMIDCGGKQIGVAGQHLTHTTRRRVHRMHVCARELCRVANRGGARRTWTHTLTYAQPCDPRFVAHSWCDDL